MKLFVTGNLGYIGSVLTPILVKRGYDVAGYDSNYYEGLTSLPHEFNSVSQITKDIREVAKEDLKGVEAIIHLAGLSNDPLGEFDPRLTREINYEGTIKLANLAKESGIKRFVFVASQSMYGISDNSHELDEDDSEKNPVTEYAKTKWAAECELKNLNSPEFSVVSFRPSTVFGVSPRLRCDIVFNRMVACAYTTGKIEIRNDGTPWRPVVHVKDVSQALIAGIEAPDSLIAGESFNVGIPDGNFSLKDLAEAAKRSVPGSEIIYTNEENDPRTYRVSFHKILTQLKDYFSPEWDLDKGGAELIEFFRETNFNEETLRGRMTNRLPQLKHLLVNGLIDPELYPVNSTIFKERK